MIGNCSFLRYAVYSSTAKFKDELARDNAFIAISYVNISFS